jgi:hypothetical protein
MTHREEVLTRFSELKEHLYPETLVAAASCKEEIINPRIENILGANNDDNFITTETCILTWTEY